jgi:hypothetical protein
MYYGLLSSLGTPSAEAHNGTAAKHQDLAFHDSAKKLVGSPSCLRTLSCIGPMRRVQRPWIQALDSY